MSSNNQKLIDALAHSVAESFENMAFKGYDSYQLISKIHFNGSPYFCTEIDLHEPLNGKLQLICNEVFAAETMQAIIGENFKEISEQEVADSLNEVINTICGCFMRKLTPQDSNFDFGLPNFGRLDSKTEKNTNRKNLTVAFSFDDDIVYCRLFSNNT